jgi:cytochrome c2
MTPRSIVVAAVLVVLSLAGVASAQPPSSPPGDSTAGAALFRTRCSACHVADLIRFQRESRSLDALAAAMWNHAPEMARNIQRWKEARPYFTSGEMRDLVAFLSPQARAGGSTGDAPRGERFVVERGCLSCHSTSAQPGTRGGTLDGLKGIPSPSSIAAQMWNHVFLMDLEVQAARGTWVRMTDAEMADVLAYLERLNTGRGR